ncbi:hypothetical protein [Advenella mimigardefordensis]|uniref:hypothetical protein n=1 Tax=Advenella mimigardefordensis TaxID=302406 RepID=UPI00046D00D1|nr:hypothetical protein [Advenella mimigardefordensis]
MKRVFPALALLLALANSQAQQPGVLPSQSTFHKVTPPIPVTGILGVFCPKEAFLKHQKV